MTTTGKIALVILIIVIVGAGFLIFKPQSSLAPNPTPDPAVTGECFIGGCSSQICSDQRDVISTCEYKEEYACYQTATCERQVNGQCGWTETPTLSSCLNSSTTRIAAGYVAGHVTIGPICPVEQEGKPCKVPPEMYSSREVIIYESNGVTIKEKGKIDVDGNYRIALSPGNYFVQIKPAGIGPGEKKPVTIKSFETTVVNFDIDTGIR